MLCPHLAEAKPRWPRCCMIRIPQRHLATHGQPQRGRGSPPAQLLFWRFIELVLLSSKNIVVRFSHRLKSVQLPSFESRLFHVWQQPSKGKQVERNLTCLALNQECGEIMPSNGTRSSSPMRTISCDLLPERSTAIDTTVNCSYPVMQQDKQNFKGNLLTGHLQATAP